MINKYETNKWLNHSVALLFIKRISVCVYNVNALHLVMIFFYLFSEKRIPLKQIHSVMSSIYI